LLVYFNYILFNFQRPFTLSHRSDFLILSLRNFFVNTFFNIFLLFILTKICFLSFKLLAVSLRIWLIISSKIINKLLYLFNMMIYP